MKRNLKFSILAIITILMLVMPIVPVMAETNLETTFVAKIGDNSYTTLVEAVSAVPTDGTQTTITLLKNVEDGTGFKVVSGQNIVIDFNNYSYDASNPLVGSTGTETNGCQMLKGSTVTLKNGTLLSTSAAILIQNYSNLTLENMTVDTTMGSADYALSNNSGKVNIIGNTTIKGNSYAFDMCWAPNKNYPEGTQITVDTTGTIQGDIELGLWGTWADNVKSTLTIKNINHVGKIVASEPRLKEQLKIEGGTYSSDVSEYVAEGYVCKKIGDNYLVRTENMIILPNETVEGGTVTVTKEKAVEGETVELVPAAKEGYKFSGVTVKDALGNVIDVTDGKFIMPNSNVTVEVIFSKLPVKEEEKTQETEVPVIDPTQEVKEVTVGIADKDAVDKVLLESLNANKELAELSKDSNVKVSVEVADIELTEEEKAEMNKTLAESGVDVHIAKFFDISVLVLDKDSQDELGKLSELNKKIEFTVALPQDLQSVKEGYTRVFFVVREHNGTVEELETTISNDGKFLTFASDKFSAYAIAYVDVPNEESTDAIPEPEGNNGTVENTDAPKTGDVILPIFAALAVISVAGIVVFAVNNRKNIK